jgi:hypothetical protein
VEPLVLAAIITGACTVIAALIGAWVAHNRRQRARDDRLARIEASIGNGTKPATAMLTELLAGQAQQDKRIAELERHQGELCSAMRDLGRKIAGGA